MRARIRQTGRRRPEATVSKGLTIARAQADVVITSNALCGAIQYTPGRCGRPKSWLRPTLYALRIKEIARKHNVPMVETGHWQRCSSLCRSTRRSRRSYRRGQVAFVYRCGLRAGLRVRAATWSSEHASISQHSRPKQRTGSRVVIEHDAAAGIARARALPRICAPCWRRAFPSAG